MKSADVDNVLVRAGHRITGITANHALNLGNRRLHKLVVEE